MKRKGNRKVRHGDVILRRVEDLGLSPDLSKLKKLNTNVLAHGEVTGHMHALGCTHETVREFGETELTNQPFAIYEDADGTMYVNVEAPTMLSHQEHFTSEVAPGLYRIRIAKQYDPFRDVISNVVD